MWREPLNTLGGKTFWHDLAVNQFFKFQKHVAEGSGARSLVGSFRKIAWGTGLLFRIIINVSPFCCIAEGNTMEEVNEHWNFLNQHIVKILENKQSWSTYAIYLFSENYKLLNENSDKFLSLFNQPQNVNPQNNNIQTQTTLDKSNDFGSNSNLIGVETRQVEPENECKICFDGEINTVIVNCGHQVMCEKCSIDLPLKECPVCRSPIGDKGIIKVYKS